MPSRTFNALMALWDERDERYAMARAKPTEASRRAAVAWRQGEARAALGGAELEVALRRVTMFEEGR